MDIIYTEEWITANADRINWSEFERSRSESFSCGFHKMFQEYLKEIPWRNEYGWHRINGPALTLQDGTECWFKNGKRHRTDGPAKIRASGSKEWWVYGKRHRIDGPAEIHADGSLVWFLNDEELTEESWKEKMQIQ